MYYTVHAPPRGRTKTRGRSPLHLLVLADVADPFFIHALHDVAHAASGHEDVRAVVQHRAVCGAIECDLTEAPFSACLLHVGAVGDDVVPIIVVDITHVDNLIFR